MSREEKEGHSCMLVCKFCSLFVCLFTCLLVFLLSLFVILLLLFVVVVLLSLLLWLSVVVVVARLLLFCFCHAFLSVLLLKSKSVYTVDIFFLSLKKLLIPFRCSEFLHTTTWQFLIA